MMEVSRKHSAIPLTRLVMFVRRIIIIGKPLKSIHLSKVTFVSMHKINVVLFSLILNQN